MSAPDGSIASCDEQHRGDTLDAAEILELSGCNDLGEVKELALRGMGLTSIEHVSARLCSLELLSLSQNHLATVRYFTAFVKLTHLNLNCNALTSLQGLERCAELQQLHAANNRIRDVSCLARCSRLQVLNIFRNGVSELAPALSTLGQLPQLADLSLNGNPCSQDPAEYPSRVASQLRALTQLDGELVDRASWASAALPGTSAPAASQSTRPPEGLNTATGTGSTQALHPGCHAACTVLECSGEGQLGVTGGAADGMAPPRTLAREATPSSHSSKHLLSPGNVLDGHPLLLEYVVRMLLDEQCQQDVAATTRKSFVARLRSRAAVANSLQGADPAWLAASRAFSSDTWQALAASDQQQLPCFDDLAEVVKLLVNACEKLRREVEALRQQQAQPGSCGSGLGADVQQELQGLRKQNRLLQAENKNMAWLIDENKQLKAELASLRQGTAP